MVPIDPKANIIIDLETLGTSPTSIILAIGACTLDKRERFKILISWINWPKSCSVDMDTVNWWKQQPEDLYTYINSGTASPELALNAFSKFCKTIERNTGKAIKVWGNGASFDLSILAHAYYVMKQELPWAFYNERCFRTIKNLFPLKTKFERPAGLTEHDPLADALYQSDWLMKIIEEQNNAY